MNETEKSICFNCNEEFEGEPGLEYCEGGPEVYKMCQPCNKISGQFIFLRQVQLMAEQVENSDDH